MNKRKNIDLPDMEWVKKSCELCSEVGARVSRGTSAKYGRVTQSNVQMTGITENIPRIGSVRDLEAGRHLIQNDIDQARMVAVVGTDLVEAFFGSMEPLGKEVLLDGRLFKIVGVAQKKGSVFGESQDNFAWVPITSFRKIYGTRRSITISAEAREMEIFEAAQDQVRVAMRVRRHLDYDKKDDFEIETGRDRHGALAERHPRHLRGDHRGHRHLPPGGRHRGHEHHARLRDRADPGDRGEEGAGRAPPRHPPAVHRGVGHPVGGGRCPGYSGRGYVLHGIGRHPRGHDVRRLLGPRATVGRGARALRLHRRRTGRGNLPREPRCRPRPRHRLRSE